MHKVTTPEKKRCLHILDLRHLHLSRSENMSRPSCATPTEVMGQTGDVGDPYILCCMQPYHFRSPPCTGLYRAAERGGEGRYMIVEDAEVDYASLPDDCRTTGFVPRIALSGWERYAVPVEG